MKRSRVFRLAAGLAVVLYLAVGCSGKKMNSPPLLSSEKTCIQGTVWMKNPYDASPARYPGAKVTVWRHGSNDPLGEAVADPKGNYSILVPMGDFHADLRVWGLMMIRGKNHTCRMSVNNIDLGTVPRPCGQDSIRMDIMTECEEYVSGRGRN
jgi:hypothetical protein